jgi:hypothetical protein
VQIVFDWFARRFSYVVAACLIVQVTLGITVMKRQGNHFANATALGILWISVSLLIAAGVILVVKCYAEYDPDEHDVVPFGESLKGAPTLFALSSFVAAICSVVAAQLALF